MGLSDITISYNRDELYKKINWFAIFGHFVSAVCMMGFIWDKDPLIFPYTETFLKWDNIPESETCPLGSRTFETSNGKFCIQASTQPVYCNDDNECYGLNLGLLIIFFHILSFFFQLGAAITDYTGPILGYEYSVMVSENKNPLRFIEYSFSASIMLISIALLNGVTDINLITSIAILTSSCQLCGLAVEYVDSNNIKILLHFVGWLQFVWSYCIIGHAFFKSVEDANENGGNGPPDFVFAIVLSLFLLYSSFGFVQMFELCTDISPYKKECAYVMLSLIAKTLLGWMIFSNVLILSN